MEDIVAIVAYVLLLGALGATTTIAVGKISGWRWRNISIVMGASLAPLCIVVYGIWLIHYHRSGPSSDMNGLAAFGFIFLPAISLPITAWSSMAVARKFAWARPIEKGK